jgi:glycosyltransferase involved in cell wall biosynthesis
MSSSAIRVAVDARSLQDRPIGGVGRSIAHLLPELARAAQLDLLLDERRPAPGELPDGVGVHALRGPASGRGVSWLQLAVPRWLRGYPGVFHCPFYGLPYRQPVPMVVTIHDLTFEFPHDWYSREQRFVFQRQARWAAKTARRIIVHSEHVKAAVVERYGCYGAHEDRVAVVRFPVDERFAPDAPGRDRVLARLDLRPPYVAALGGSPRRQLPVAVQAWAQALVSLGCEPEELPLVVVGTDAPEARPGIHYAGPLPDADWAAVLAGASAFCYATAYEGYGVPALEAAACGIPVACARVGSLPELLGEAAAWAPAAQPALLARALAGVLADPQRARELGASGRDVVRSLPSWAQVAELTLETYRTALAG